MNHVAVFLGAMVCYFGVLFAGSAVLALSEAYVSPWVFTLMDNLLPILLVICTVPLVYGLGVFEYNAVHDAGADITDLFYAFSSGRRFQRSFLLFWSLLWRFFVIFALPLALTNEFTVYTYGESVWFYPVTVAGSYDLTYFLLVVLILLSYTFCSAVYARCFTAFYLAVAHEEQSVSRCFAAAQLVNHGRNRRFFRLICSFFPLILLSVLSFGILFVLYTLPVMLISCFSLAKACCNTENASRYLG